MSGEILPQELVDPLGGRGVAAGVQHATTAISEVIPHDERNLP